ncbi:MAG: 4Fe-4S binding protein [Desulfuromonadaceae bacterium]|nr:4Fe-4S binding protein [Desulfuromonadaceae bacterium]MDD5105331.1 4Fe-4S binding protein [Desulfuromonadaceae bacterium]
MSSRYMQPLRILVQMGLLGFVVWLGVSFYRFVQIVASGGASVTVARPYGVEAFLPISGLMGATAWLKGGGLNAIHPAAVVIFVTAIALSLLLRRSFCSWICPIATISEVSWKSGFRLLRLNWRLPFWLDAALRAVKYLLCAFFIFSIGIAMSPYALQKFIQSDYHKIADVRLMNFFLHISPLVLTIILVLLGLSLLLRNPFCRYLCPYGALLGLVAVFSPVRVTRDPESCVSCGVCSQVCPTYIDVMNKSSVASPECIACWRCISHCRVHEALSMRVVKRFALPGLLFAILVVLLFWGGTAIGKLGGHWQSSITLEEYVRLLGK